ncbi:mitotic-spindle organizing gamma-tubulin ring associated [Caudoviricetes sp.]|nr:mitotic-spindle organizing gamma-tubulin ring associated [Caudoviricetes sp.]UOF81871.1 mitotic-spindle organizing gamma-tubulin ring associated [Caudoviricetes sp.]
MPKQWGVPVAKKKPSKITLDKISALLSVGLTPEKLAACCSTCAEAVAWLNRPRRTRKQVTK